jgi:hypothetical protein
MRCRCIRCTPQIDESTLSEEWCGHSCELQEGEAGRKQYPIGMEIRCVSPHICMNGLECIPIATGETGIIRGYRHYARGECGVVIDIALAPDGHQLYLPHHLINENWEENNE